MSGNLLQEGWQFLSPLCVVTMTFHTSFMDSPLTPDLTELQRRSSQRFCPTIPRLAGLMDVIARKADKRVAFQDEYEGSRDAISRHIGF